MPGVMRAIALALVLLAAPLAGCASSEEANTADQGPAPEWSFTDTDGQTHSRESASGSPTVIFFMATWCSSCQKKTSDMKRVHDDYAQAGVDVFSVTVDSNEGDEDLERWKEDFSQNWPHGTDDQAQLQQAFGVRSQSNVVILDGEGHKVEHWGYGAATYDEMSAVLDDLGA